MFKRDDLIDIIVSHLKAGTDAGRTGDAHKERASPHDMLPKGRLFLSEYEIKKRLTGSAQHLTIPRDAIISPLARGDFDKETLVGYNMLTKETVNIYPIPPQYLGRCRIKYVQSSAGNIYYSTCDGKIYKIGDNPEPSVPATQSNPAITSTSTPETKSSVSCCFVVAST